MGEKFKVRVTSSRLFTIQGDTAHPKYKTTFECMEASPVKLGTVKDFSFDSPRAYTPATVFELVLREPVTTIFLGPEIPIMAPFSSYVVIPQLQAMIKGKDEQIKNQASALRRQGIDLAVSKGENEALTLKRDVLAEQVDIFSVDNDQLRKTVDLYADQIKDLRDTLMKNRTCPMGGITIAHHGAAAYCKTLEDARGQVKLLQASLKCVNATNSLLLEGSRDSIGISEVELDSITALREEVDSLRRQLSDKDREAYNESETQRDVIERLENRVRDLDMELSKKGA